MWRIASTSSPRLLRRKTLTDLTLGQDQYSFSELGEYSRGGVCIHSISTSHHCRMPSKQYRGGFSIPLVTTRPTLLMGMKQICGASFIKGTPCMRDIDNQFDSFRSIKIEEAFTSPKLTNNAFSNRRQASKRLNSV